MAAPHVTDPAKTIERMIERISEATASRDYANEHGMAGMAKVYARQIAAYRGVVTRCTRMLEATPAVDPRS